MPYIGAYLGLTPPAPEPPPTPVAPVDDFPGYPKIAPPAPMLGESTYWTGTTEPWGIPAYLPLATDTTPPDAVIGDYVDACLSDTLRVIVSGSSAGVVARITQRDTGTLVDESVISTGNPKDVRVLLSAGTIVCLWRDTGVLNLSYWTGEFWTLPSEVVSSGVTSFDVALTSAGFHLLWRIGSSVIVGEYLGINSTRLHYLFGIALTTTAVPNANAALCVSTDTVGAITLAVVFEASTGLYAAMYGPDGTPIVERHLTTDTGWIALSVSARNLSPNKVGAAHSDLPFVAHGGTTALVRVWEFRAYDAAVATTTKFNSTLASKSFTVGNEVFAWLLAKNSMTHYLMAGAVVTLTAGYADREDGVARVTSGSPAIQTLAMVNPDPLSPGDFGYVSRWVWARPFNTGQAYARVGNARVGYLDFLPELSTAQYGKGVYLSGSAVKVWDGVRLLDAGFQDYPVVTPSSPTTGGGLTSGGVYFWFARAVRYSATGERFESATTITSQVTLPGGDTEIALAIATLPSVEPGVELEIFRTVDGGTTFFLEGTVSNDGGASASFVSTMTDADLLKQPEDSHETGIGNPAQLETWGPIGCAILATLGDRLWGAGGQVPAGSAQFSLLHNDGFGAGFDDLAGTYEADNQGADVTSIAGFNGAVVLFQLLQIQVIDGSQGPDNFGNGAFPAPQLVLAAGAVNHFGTILCQPGIAYWGAGGPLLLNQSVQITNISSPVRPLTETLTPSGVRVDPSRMEVVWYTADGTAILWNYMADSRWATWSGVAVAGAMDTGMVSPDGTILTDDVDALGDAGVPFGFTLSTGNVRPEDLLEGHTEARRVGINGDYLGDHSVRFRVYYDGSPLWSEEFTWEPVTDTWLEVSADFSTMTPAEIDALLPVDHSGTYGTSKRLRRQTCRYIRVEVSDVSSDHPTFVPYELAFELGQKPGFGRTAVNTMKDS